MFFKTISKRASSLPVKLIDNLLQIGADIAKRTTGSGTSSALGDLSAAELSALKNDRIFDNLRIYEKSIFNDYIDELIKISNQPPGSKKYDELINFASTPEKQNVIKKVNEILKQQKSTATPAVPPPSSSPKTTKSPPANPTTSARSPNVPSEKLSTTKKIQEYIETSVKFGSMIKKIISFVFGAALLGGLGAGGWYIYKNFIQDNDEVLKSTFDEMISCISDMDFSENIELENQKNSILEKLNELKILTLLIGSSQISEQQKQRYIELNNELFGGNDKSSISNFLNNISLKMQTNAIDKSLHEDILESIACVGNNIEKLASLYENSDAIKSIKNNGRDGSQQSLNPPRSVSQNARVDGIVTLSTGQSYGISIGTRRPSIPQRFILYFAKGEGPDGFFSSPEFTAFVDPNDASPLGGVGLVPNAIGKEPIEERISSAIKYCYNNDIDSGNELRKFMVREINSGVGKIKRIFSNEPEERALNRAIDFYKSSRSQPDEILGDDKPSDNNNRMFGGGAMIDRMRERREDRREDRENRREQRGINVKSSSLINFMQKNQQSINKDNLTVNKMASTEKTKVTVYDDAVKGLEDKLTKSYYAGLNSMYNEKPKAPKTDLKDLYGLNEKSIVDVIQSAHPKSVYIAESMGDGALIENTLEQQAKTESKLLSGPTGNFRSKNAFVLHLDKLAKHAKESGKEEAYELIKSTINKLENY
jgi:hypothetical protein